MEGQNPELPACFYAEEDRDYIQSVSRREDAANSKRYWFHRTYIYLG